MQSERDIKTRFNYLMDRLEYYKNSNLETEPRKEEVIQEIGNRLEEVRRVLNYWGVDKLYL